MYQRQQPGEKNLFQRLSGKSARALIDIQHSVAQAPFPAQYPGNLYWLPYFLNT